MRRRQDRDDPAACKQANTQESAHRFSFSLGVNFLRRYHSRRCTKEHSKWFAIAQLWLYSATDFRPMPDQLLIRKPVKSGPVPTCTVSFTRLGRLICPFQGGVLSGN